VDVKSKHAEYNPYLKHELGGVDREREVLNGLVNTPPLPPSVARAIIRLVEECKHKDQTKLFPQILHRFYFASLLQQKHFDHVFVRGTHLVHILPNSAFAATIQQLMNEVAVPRFIRHAEEALVVDKTQPWNSVKLVSISLDIMNILHNSSFLLDGLNTALPELLESATRRLPASLRSIATDTGYKASKFSTGKHPKQDMLDMTKRVLAQMDRIRDVKSQRVKPFLADQAAAFRQALEQVLV
jgi:hypothetical protein